MIYLLVSYLKKGRAYTTSVKKAVLSTEKDASSKTQWRKIVNEDSKYKITYILKIKLLKPNRNFEF